MKTVESFERNDAVKFLLRRKFPDYDSVFESAVSLRPRNPDGVTLGDRNSGTDTNSGHRADQVDRFVEMSAYRTSLEKMSAEEAAHLGAGFGVPSAIRQPIAHRSRCKVLSRMGTHLHPDRCCGLCVGSLVFAVSIESTKSAASVRCFHIKLIPLSVFAPPSQSLSHRPRTANATDRPPFGQGRFRVKPSRPITNQRSYPAFVVVPWLRLQSGLSVSWVLTPYDPTIETGSTSLDGVVQPRLS